MTTLQELRTCVLDGHIATRFVDECLENVFVRDQTFVYEYDVYPSFQVKEETFETFDALLGRINDLDDEWEGEIPEDSDWDLVDEEADELSLWRALRR